MTIRRGPWTNIFNVYYITLEVLQWLRPYYSGTAFSLWCLADVCVEINIHWLNEWMNTWVHKWRYVFPLGAFLKGSPWTDRAPWLSTTHGQLWDISRSPTAHPWASVANVPTSGISGLALAALLCTVIGWEQPRGSVASQWTKFAELCFCVMLFLLSRPSSLSPFPMVRPVSESEGSACSFLLLLYLSFTSVIPNKSKRAIAEGCRSTVLLEAEPVKGVLRAHLHGCYTFVSWKAHRVCMNYEFPTMFLLDGNQNFSAVYVNSSNIVIIFVKNVYRTIILVQISLGKKPVMYLLWVIVFWVGKGEG